jgi:hypothetical protein|tara:strand:+ start:417 stop:995 length:579 start_codon:yes stop_codon:yes gene_type:complete
MDDNETKLKKVNKMFNTNVEKEIVKVIGLKTINEKIFDKYKRMTIEKLEKSISEGNGRYNPEASQYRPYSTAKPSLNWKVYNKADNIEDELLEIWLKVGIKKVAIGQDENGNQILTKRYAPMDAIEQLEALREQVNGLTRENGQAFWDVAINQSKPKTKPTAKDANGNLLFSDWKYEDDVNSKNFDTYIAIA